MARESDLSPRGKRPDLLAAVCVSVCLLSSVAADAAEALAAVAGNFSDVIDRLQADFESTGEHTLVVSTGSTGKLYAQIDNGAPFDLFLAADQVRPEVLERAGKAVAGSRFTYAIGRLTLWSPDPARLAVNGAATLRAGKFRKLAIANPELAPYGAAAIETLASLELLDTVRDRIVMGENIGQAHAMVATGNAELGFVALSYILSPRNSAVGSRWDVPQEFYSPIRQDAVLLVHGAGNSAALAFLDYLASDAARVVIESYGYAVK